MQARAKFDFVASEQDELSFTHGTVLKIISMEDDANWYKAELRGEIGYIPKTYIDMMPHSWFYGKISRSDSERLLLSKRSDGRMIQPDGAFLVRYSESSPGDISISVKCHNTVQHYKILRGGGKYYLWVVKFDSVNELIDYHRKSSVSRSTHLPLVDMVDNRNASRLMLSSNDPAATVGSSPFSGQSNLNNKMHNTSRNINQSHFNKVGQQSQSAGLSTNFQQINNDPNSIQYVVAAFDFDPQDVGEIGIRRGDVIRVIEKYDDNWLTGELNGKVGLLPISYVRPL
ncbi:hypothetical protein GJ496_009817 [Pomphorhynchus laevis]|nr:hypothetical protein GJ496_009817 [Pomphorhynchus laevis]